jgi:hypothetical protein
VHRLGPVESPSAYTVADGRESSRVGAIRRLGNRTGGIAGNERLTAATAAVLLAMLAAEGVTIVFIGPLLGPHILIGVALIPPVLLKLASTGYRFARYYLRASSYRARGAPPLILRATAPFLIAFTALVLATGVALLIHGPDTGRLLLLHKVAFFGWFGFMTLHVLGHVLRVPSLASADWRRSTPQAAVAGSTLRIVLVAAAVAVGLVIGAASLSLAGSWLSFNGVGG